MDDIAAVRLELSTFAAGKPKAVQNAVRNLDGWLAVMSAAGHVPDDFPGTLACAARAVETLRSAQHEFAKI